MFDSRTAATGMMDPSSYNTRRRMAHDAPPEYFNWIGLAESADVY